MRITGESIAEVAGGGGRQARRQQPPSGRSAAREDGAEPPRCRSSHDQQPPFSCCATASGIEILFVRRAPELKFMGGAWVFPGGALAGRRTAIPRTT